MGIIFNLSSTLQANFSLNRNLILDCTNGGILAELINFSEKHMSFISQNLNLPYIAPAQAQKHITHNEALRALDAIVHLSLISKSQTTPPSTPVEGTRYFIAATATDEWTGKDGNIAAFQDGAWAYYSPQIGWQAWIEDESSSQIWDGTAWQNIAPAQDHQNLDHMGINTTADTTNRLAVSSPATLLSHAGNGHQLKLNKNTVGDTATLLYQSNWSGRAEIGLAGDDDFHFKVSGDGSTWTEALTIDKDNGDLAFGDGMQYTQSLNRLDLFERDEANNLATRIDNSNFGGAWTLYRGGTAQVKIFATAPYEFNMQNVATHDFIVHGIADNLLFVDAGKNRVGISTAAPVTTLDVNGPIRPKSYSVAALPSAATNGAGAIIFVSDETGGAVLAFSDGTNWRRVTDRAIIS